MSPSFRPRIKTAFSFTFSKPAAFAAAIPSRVCSRKSRPVMAQYLSGSSVSSEMFAVLTRNLTKALARVSPPSTGFARSEPLVERPMSVIRRNSLSCRNSVRTLRRVSGSPPVMRILVTPRSEAIPYETGYLVVVQNLGAWQPFLQLLRHAVETTLVAPVGDRYPQITDLMAKSIFHSDKLRIAAFRARR